MSFLFKSKKPLPAGNGVPPASRKLSSRDGPPPNGAGAPTFNPFPLEQTPTMPGGGGAVSRVGPPPGARNATSPSPPESKGLGSRAGGMDMMKQGSRVPPQRPPPDSSLYPWSHRRLSFIDGTNPFPRYGASVNGAASKDGEIYMMGGLIDGSTVKGDLWIFEAGIQPTRCYEVETTSEGPGPRVGHASLLVGNAFIVFGGDTKVDEHDILDDTLYLLNTSTRDWSRAAPAGPRPPGRYGHTLNIIGSKIYVMGGQVEGYFFNDLLAFDLNALQGVNSRWEILVANTNDGGPPQGQSPPARTNHTVITYDEKLYLFGGTDGLKWFNDVWTYDPRVNAWAQQDCIGYIPAAREGHTAAIVGDVMYVFGGRTEEGKDLGDVAGFRISTRRWYTFQNMGPSPSPRSGHGMTAFNQQIFVFGGEPSSAPRNPIELSDAYVLDTSKIRYPDEKAAPKSGNIRRPSVTDRSGTPQQERSASRDGSVSSQMSRHLNTKGSQDSIASATGNYSRPQELINSYATNSQVFNKGAPTARNTASPGPPVPPSGPPPSGPPPSQALPQPKTNGIRSMPGIEGRESPRLVSKADRVLGTNQPSRENKPGMYSQPREMNDTRGPIAPIAGLPPSGAAQDGPYDPTAAYVHQQQNSLESVNRRNVETPDAAARAGEDLIQSSFNKPSYADSGVGSSPALSTQQLPENIAKELETMRSKNVWYASELALARKAGYRSSAAESSVSLSDDKTVDAFGDEEKPLLEALLRMRNELVKMQESLSVQSAAAAERVAQAEREKEAAVQEAMYLRTQQASRDGDTPAEGPGSSMRTEEANRRLASALEAQNDLQFQIEHLSSTLEAERRARETAEESANAAHSRTSELDQHKQRSVSELESLRAELHDTQKLAREHSTTSADALSSSRMLQVDKDDLVAKFAAAQEQQQNHARILSSMRDAVAASSEKVSLLERQVERERQQRTVVEEKLAQLRAEHESSVAELERANSKLSDTEELVAQHAAEAETHRAALLAGLDKATSRGLDNGAANDERVIILQQSLDGAKSLAQLHKNAADNASSRLRSAEERIAGLEAYQEQSSLEGLSLRKQLQTASRELVSHQAEHSGLQQQLSKHKLELTAWQMQHSTLKNILSDRGVDTSNLPKDMGEYSANSNNMQRLQQLEEQIEASSWAQEEMRQTYEKREQELRKTRDAEYGSLENECQQMREYIEGFHDVAEKLKKNIKKEKAENQSLREQLEKHSSTSAATVDFDVERSTLQRQIEELQGRVNKSQADLESQMQQLKTAMARSDAHKEESVKYQGELAKATEQNRTDVESLRSHNAQLESRAEEAENKVKMLLDSVGTSVNNYRRQSQNVSALNGGLSVGHNRGLSTNSIGAASTYSNGPSEGNPDRGSAVFDSFVTELDNLRNQWETTSKTYNNRLSDRSITDAAVSGGTASGEAGEGTTSVSNSMADWRKRLELDDDEAVKQ